MDERGNTLLSVARNAIATRLGRAGIQPAVQDWLHEPGATFVTLTRQGVLRGCIGSLEPHRSLLDDVTANAIAAATRDHRFQPLRPDELDSTRIEVSLLSETASMSFDSEQHALSQLQPGIDGLVLQYGQRRSTFLPQVWESLSEPQVFLSELKRKAGLPADFWHPDIHLARYQVSKWKEAGDAQG